MNCPIAKEESVLVSVASSDSSVSPLSSASNCTGCGCGGRRDMAQPEPPVHFQGMDQDLYGKLMIYYYDTLRMQAAIVGENQSVPSSPVGKKGRRRRKRRGSRGSSEASASTAITYAADESPSVVLPLIEEKVVTERSAGFCYLQLVLPSERESVKAEIGANPTFEKLLSLDALKCFTGANGLRVQRLVEGTYHLGFEGVSVDVCLSSVVVNAVASGYRVSPGSLAEVYSRTAFKAGFLDKAPRLGDTLGSMAGVQQGRFASVEVQRQQVKVGESEVGVSLDGGYCYLRAVKLGSRVQALAALGSAPTFGELMAAPKSWFQDSFGSLAIKRVQGGMYHLGSLGYTASLCFRAVVADALVFGYKVKPGSFAERFLAGKVVYSQLGSVPRWMDRLGAESDDSTNGSYLGQARTRFVRVMDASMEQLVRQANPAVLSTRLCGEYEDRGPPGLVLGMRQMASECPSLSEYAQRVVLRHVLSTVGGVGYAVQPPVDELPQLAVAVYYSTRVGVGLVAGLLPSYLKLVRASGREVVYRAYGDSLTARQLCRMPAGVADPGVKVGYVERRGVVSFAESSYGPPQLACLFSHVLTGQYQVVRGTFQSVDWSADNYCDSHCRLFKVEKAV